MTNVQSTDSRPRFRRQARAPHRPKDDLFVAGAPEGSPSKSVQDLPAGLRKRVIHVKNRPARFPPAGVWPLELRAEMVAALLDFDTTRQLCKAIATGTAPRPGAVRDDGMGSEVVWSFHAVRAFVAARHRVSADSGESG
jgi:hypothetical protein